MTLQILLQTTLLAGTQDDWTIDTFSLLQTYLKSLRNSQGSPLCEVTARDREPDLKGNDPILSNLAQSQFDQLWLFALDTGEGLSASDCAGITQFHQQGRAIFTTRDHQDMGASMCALPTIGAFHYFHSQQPDPDQARCCPDDIYTPTISYPNYHSGRNGDYQVITPSLPLHELLKHPAAPTGAIAFFPAHPHEGGVGIPDGMTHARVVATGISKVSQRAFNLVVAADRTHDSQGNHLGRIVAQSTFHHFVDYNWDTSMGCPSFVAEPPGDGMATEPRALEDIHTYVRNLVLWLANLSVV